MSDAEAERIRRAPAVETLDTGISNINRVVGDPKFGLVIDRRSISSGLPALAEPPGYWPRPYFEHDILHNLNEAGVLPVQKVFHANPDGNSLIIEYIEGEAFTFDDWFGDAELRGEYCSKLPKALADLAGLPAEVIPRDIRPEEKGYWPGRLESAAQYGEILRERTVYAWDRACRGWAVGLLQEIGSTEGVRDQLQDFEISGDRPLALLHNDLHPWNTLREPFTLLDWTLATDGDPLWDALLVREFFPRTGEQGLFLENYRNLVPRAYLTNFDRDAQSYQHLLGQRAKVISAAVISKAANNALSHAARLDRQAGRREAVRPYAKQIHRRSVDFLGRPPERTEEETHHLVLSYVNTMIAMQDLGARLGPVTIDLGRAPGRRFRSPSRPVVAPARIHPRAHESRRAAGLDKQMRKAP